VANEREETYLFVDGGYLSKIFDGFTENWYGVRGSLNFHPLRRSYDSVKSFYYDCLNDLPIGAETPAQVEARVEVQEIYFDTVRQPRGSHVKLGSLTGSRKRRRQKQVDIMLAVDMLSHAANKNMRRAILLAGDQDFIPVVEALVQLGLFVEVAGEPRSTSRDLRAAADGFRPIKLKEIIGWTKEPLRSTKDVLGEQFNLPAFSPTLERYGHIGEVKLHTFVAEEDNQFYARIIGSEMSNVPLFVSDPDESKVLLYVELQYGPILWDDKV